MGKVLTKLFGNKEMRVCMLGLDAAGKTTILYKFKLGNQVSTIPTVGFNVETVQFKKTKFTVWDIGGQDRLRPLWKNYYNGTHALVYVVDSSDHERMEEAAKELQNIVSQREMSEAVILVFANKQDIPSAMNPNQITESLGLTKLNNRVWYVQPLCALTGDGLFEGFTWLVSQKSR